MEQWFSWGNEKTGSQPSAQPGHSFAERARQNTDNIYNLSKTLGHSSIKITEVYLAGFDEKAVDDTLDEVFKWCGFNKMERLYN